MSVRIVERELPVLLDGDMRKILGKAVLEANEDGTSRIVVDIPKSLTPDFTGFFSDKTPIYISFGYYIKENGG